LNPKFWQASDFHSFTAKFEATWHYAWVDLDVGFGGAVCCAQRGSATWAWRYKAVTHVS
jgi:hypothetical protein